jgi:hypothetical protein
MINDMRGYQEYQDLAIFYISFFQKISDKLSTKRVYGTKKREKRSTNSWYSWYLVPLLTHGGKFSSKQVQVDMYG